MSTLIIRDANAQDIPVIHSLASRIWPIAYREVITKEQIDFMLKWMYDADSLLRQMNEGATFLVLSDDGVDVGFASFGLEKGDFKLHKLYVDTALHGKGYGRALVNEISWRLKNQGVKALYLQVNKKNKAKDFYKRLGFVVDHEDVFDIGHGFVMDDYIMRLDL